MNDRLLRVTVILSVLALVGMAGAGAAAAQDFNVTVEDAPVVAPFGEDIDVTINTTNVASSGSGDADVTFAADDMPGNIGPGADVTGPQYTTPVLNPGESDVRTITLNTDTDYQPLTDNSTSNDIFHGAFVNASGTNVVDDTDEANFTVGTDSNGRVTVITQDTASSPNRVSTDVDLYSSDTFNSVNDPGPLVRSGITNSNGEIQFSGLAVGENDTLSEDYTAVAAVDDPEFESDTSQAQLFDPDQTSDTARIAVERIALPEEFDITQSAESAIADGEDSITFNVSILGNLEGDRLANEPYTVFHDGGDAVSIANGTQLSTESNGFDEFEVSSNSSQRVTFEFVADNEGAEGQTVTEIREKNFILSGEGQIIGDVWDVDDPNLRSLPDTRVWAVQKDTFTQNSIRVPPSDFGPDEGFDSQGDDSFFRVIKTEDPSLNTPSNDTILEVTQDYRIDNDGQNENLSISRVRELDQNDSTVGSGFAVEANVNNPCSFNGTACTGTGMYVTPLEPGYYYIQQSDNQLNASDQRFVDGTTNDDFDAVGSGLSYNIGGASSFAPGGPVTPTTGPIEVTVDLTFDATQQFSQFSGQELTDITDENGEYVLKDMYTDFQAGVDYTVIANKAGYEIEFIDPLVTESGAFFEDGADENFGLERVEEDVEVNVTNLAALPSIDDAPEDAANPGAYDEFAFENQNDTFSQEVPRDGRTIDVIQVNTQTESGAPVDEEIELSIPQPGLQGTITNDVNFTGEFVAVAGGTEVSNDPDAPTVTINTGSDGQAIVWLQSDLFGEDLSSVFADNVNTGGEVCETIDGGETEIELFSGVVAKSPTDAGIVDATCKDFAGTAVLRTAELSGAVTNQDNDPVESRVWLEQIDLDASAPANPQFPVYQNINHRIEITRNGANNYDVRQVYDNFSTITNNVVDTVVIGQDTGLSANDLRNYEGFGTTMFPQIAVAGDGTDGFTLLTDSDDVNDPQTEDSLYTLPEVPAESAASPVTGVTPTGIDRATFSFTGSAVQTGVQVGRTSTANIEITTPTGAEFNVTDIDAPATVSQGDTFDVDADITNDGVATAEQDVDYELLDEDGNVVASQTQSLILGGDETQTVTFEDIDTTGLDAGNYTSVVTTPDDTAGQSAETEIVTDGTGGNGDSPIDGVSDSLWNAVTQGDGDLSLGDLGTAITQYQDDGEIDGEPIGLGQLGDLISYYQNEVA
jgi:hypothetical protein